MGLPPLLVTALAVVALVALGLGLSMLFTGVVTDSAEERELLGKAAAWRAAASAWAGGSDKWPDALLSAAKANGVFRVGVNVPQFIDSRVMELASAGCRSTVLRIVPPQTATYGHTHDHVLVHVDPKSGLVTLLSCTTKGVL